MKGSESVTTRHLLGVGMVGLLALGAVGSAGAQMPELEFVAPEEVTLTASEGETSKVSVWLRNASAQEVTPLFTLTMEDGDGDALAPAQLEVVVVDDEDQEIDASAVAPLSANSVGRYRLSLRGSGANGDASGQLIATAAGLAPGSVAVTLTPESVMRSSVSFVLLLSLFFAGVVVAIAWGGTDRVSPRAPLGTLDFDFKTSFASTLTAVGALLGTIVSAGVLPDDTVNLSKDAFVALNLLFGVAIVVAGLVYSALQRPVWVDKAGSDPPKQERKQQGHVGSFMIACFITVWAVLGELWTLGLLVDELANGESGFTDVAIWAFWIMLIGSALAVVFYALWRFESIVNSERPKPAGLEGGPPSAELPRISLL